MTLNNQSITEPVVANISITAMDNLTTLSEVFLSKASYATFTIETWELTMDSATITTSNNDPDIEAASVSSSGSSRSSRSSSSASNSPSVASTFPVDFTSPTVLAAFYGGGIAIIIFLTSSLLCCLNRRRKKIKHKSFAQDQKHREFDEVDVGSSVISQGNRHSLYETNHSGGNNQYSYQEQP
jgi:hypothetical protein